MIITNKLESNDNFSKSEEILAKYLLNEKENIKTLSTKDLANATYTSPSTVIRLAQKLGFSGWNELKDKYLEELNYLNHHFSDIDPNRPFEPNDSFMSVASKVGNLATETIEDTLSLLNNNDLKNAIELLNNAKSITVYGISNSLIMAYDFKHKMLRINKHVEIMDLPHEQVYVASNSTSDNLALIICYSGETDEVLKIAKILKNNQTPILAITSIGDNTLKTYSDCNLLISSREKLYSKIASYATNNSIHLLLDILYSCVFKLNYNKNLKYKTNVSKIVDNRFSNTEFLKENE